MGEGMEQGLNATISRFVFSLTPSPFIYARIAGCQNLETPAFLIIDWIGL